MRFRTPWLDVVCHVLFFIGACSGYLVVRRYSALSGQQWTATAVEDRGYEVAGYLASYLLPFVTVTEPEWRDLAGYAVFLFVAGVVYIRSGMFQINPTLYLMGWQVTEVTIGHGWVGYAIGRRSIRIATNFQVKRITNRVFIATIAEDANSAA